MRRGRSCRSFCLGKIGRAALLAAGVSASAGVAYADSFVILGAGQIGTWITTGFIANPNASQTDVRVAPSPVIATLVPCSPPATCPYYDISLPALGSASLPFSFSGFQFGTVYVTQMNPNASGQKLPVVQAILSDQIFCMSGDDPFPHHQSAETPVVPLSKLIAANLSTLNFPGVRPVPEAIRNSLVSNLVIGNIQRADGVAGEDLPLLLELFDQDGHLVGSTSFTLSYGETRVIGDIAGLFGIGPVGFLDGQLRVTRTSGKALMWGILYSLNSEVGVSVTTGVNLSP